MRNGQEKATPVAERLTFNTEREKDEMDLYVGGPGGFVGGPDSYLGGQNGYIYNSNAFEDGGHGVHVGGPEVYFGGQDLDDANVFKNERCNARVGGTDTFMGGSNACAGGFNAFLGCRNVFLGGPNIYVDSCDGQRDYRASGHNANVGIQDQDACGLDDYVGGPHVNVGDTHVNVGGLRPSTGRAEGHYPSLLIDLDSLPRRLNHEDTSGELRGLRYGGHSDRVTTTIGSTVASTVASNGVGQPGSLYSATPVASLCQIHKDSQRGSEQVEKQTNPAVGDSDAILDAIRMQPVDD